MQFKCVSCGEWIDVPDELIGDNDPSLISENFECSGREEQRAAADEVNSWEMNGDQVCFICGNYMEWEDCWNGCDDGYHNLYDEDPLWYDEDDIEVCTICEGRGGYWVCPNAGNHSKEIEQFTQAVAG